MSFFFAPSKRWFISGPSRMFLVLPALSKLRRKGCDPDEFATLYFDEAVHWWIAFSLEGRTYHLGEVRLKRTIWVLDELFGRGDVRVFFPSPSDAASQAGDKGVNQADLVPDSALAMARAIVLLR